MTFPPFKGKTIRLVSIGLMLIGFSGAPAAIADIPPDVEKLLQGAFERGDRRAFTVILEAAVETWPEERIALFAYAESLEIDWLNKTYIEEVRVAEREAAEALAAEKARGIWYYLDPKYWSPNVELGAGASTGDTEEVSLSLGLHAEREFETWAHRFDVFADVARRAGVTSRQRFTFERETVYSGLDELLIISYGLVEVDRFSGFDFRITETLGLGYQVLDQEGHSLRLEAGPGIRHSALDDVFDENGLLIEGGSRTEILGRLAANYALQITDNLRLEDTAGFIIGTESVRFDNELRLSASLTDRLKARLRFNTIYESDVPAGTSPWDTVTRLTLVYDF